MRTTWKFMVPIESLYVNKDFVQGGVQHDLIVPDLDVKQIHLALQHTIPCLWVGVDAFGRKDTWRFTWVGTGKDREAEGVPAYALYVGTVLLLDDSLVMHGFIHHTPTSTT